MKSAIRWDTLNKICVICGKTFPKESNDDLCGSCRHRVDVYKKQDRRIKSMLNRRIKSWKNS